VLLPVGDGMGSPSEGWVLAYGACCARAHITGTAAQAGRSCRDDPAMSPAWQSAGREITCRQRDYCSCGVQAARALPGTAQAAAAFPAERRAAAAQATRSRAWRSRVTPPRCCPAAPTRRSRCGTCASSRRPWPRSPTCQTPSPQRRQVCAGEAEGCWGWGIRRFLGFVWYRRPSCCCGRLLVQPYPAAAGHSHSAVYCAGLS
jgi:hypothetical protein